jgi:hypothetical protein
LNFLETDPTDVRVVEEVTYGAGSGLFAGRDFAIGDFLLVYRGKHMLESEDPRPDRHNFKLCYDWKGQDYIVDAEDEGGLARMINDVDPYHIPNAVAKKCCTKDEQVVYITISAIRAIVQGTYLFNLFAFKTV